MSVTLLCVTFMKRCTAQFVFDNRINKLMLQQCYNTNICVLFESCSYEFALRMFAANEKVFKLFF